MKPRILALACACLLLVAPAPSSASTATLLGVVRDPSAAVLPGATVTVRNLDTNYSRTDVTDAGGGYRFEALPVGRYEITVELQGFQTLVRSGITLDVDQPLRVDLRLELGSVSETIRVSSNAPLIDTQTAAVGQLIDNRNIVDLPLNGRNFIQLATLSSGVAASGGGGATPGGSAEGGSNNFSANGQRSTANNFILDGTDNNNLYFGLMNVLPSIDLIEEFRIQTNNYSAEYGGKGGAVVTLVTKSGTNRFQGSAFEFHRNSALDARNFFDRRDLPIPPFRLNQFGFTLGGPIRRDRTFFFGGYEGFRQRVSVTQFANVPTLAERQGIFVVPVIGPDGAVLRQTVQVPVHPTSARLFQLYPLPNSTSGAGNYLATPRGTHGRDSFSIKIDQEVSAADRLTARYTIETGDKFDPLSTASQNRAVIPGFGFAQDTGSHIFSVGYTHVFSSRVLNELRFGFNRANFLRIGEDGPRRQDFGFNLERPSDRNKDLMPSIIVGSGALVGVVSNLGVPATVPHQADTDTWQLVNTFTLTKNRHTIRAGADIRWYSIDRDFPVSQSGFIVFSGARAGQFDPRLSLAFNPLLDFALGLPTVSFNFAGDASRRFRLSAWNFYVQDSFEITPRLTLNAGLRYELPTVLNEADDRLMVWRPDLVNAPTAGVFIIGTNTAACAMPCQSLQGLEGPYRPSRKNFAPRVGIAYAPNDQTVVRLGYGVFHDTIQARFLTNVMLGPPFLNSFANLFPAFPDSFGPGKSFGGTRDAPPSPLRVTTFAEDYRFPHVQQWDLTVQRALTSDLTVEAAYVGTKGTFLTLNHELNQPVIDPNVLGRRLTAADSATINARRPFQGIERTSYFDAGDNSNYHGLQLKASQRLSNGLMFIGSYTWSKSIDVKSELEATLAGANNIKPQDSTNRRGDRGVSDFDLTHRLTFSYVYAIPSWRALPRGLADGWQLSGIFTAQSGNPFSVWTGLDRSLTGNNTDRPNLVGDPRGPRAVEQWFNTRAFVLNDIGTFGNAGRNILRGPRFVNFDLALAKESALGGGVRLQLRAEVFNVFNRPHFSIPSNVMAAPNFGALFQTIDVAQGNVGLGSGGPRLIQLGAKLLF